MWKRAVLVIVLCGFFFLWNEIENGKDDAADCDVNDELEISRVQVISIIQFHCFAFFCCCCFFFIICHQRRRRDGHRYTGTQVLPIASARYVRRLYVQYISSSIFLPTLVCVCPAIYNNTKEIEMTKNDSIERMEEEEEEE